MDEVWLYYFKSASITAENDLMGIKSDILVNSGISHTNE